MRLSNISIGTRLAVSFSLTCIITIATAVLGYALLHDIESRFLEIDAVDTAKATAAAKVAHQADALRWRLERRSLDPAETAAAEGVAALREFERQWQLLAGYRAEDAQEEQMLRTADAARARLLSVGLEIGTAVDDGRTEDAHRLAAEQLVPAHAEFKSAIDAFAARHLQDKDEQLEAARQAYRAAVLLLALFAGVSAAVSALAGWLITRSIVDPIRAARDCALRLARGDLTDSVVCRQGGSGRDEAAQLLAAMRTMHHGLREMVSGVQAKAGSVGAAAGQISAGSFDLSARTESQASSLQQTAATLGQLTASVQTTAHSGAQAAELAGGALAVASRGGEITRQVVRNMTDIEVSARKVADIIGVIDTIAFQTNILALNAAVEAARAGAQGRGFAVVATEVRSLAQRSAEAAREIKTIINASVSQVGQGTELVRQAGSTMGEIVAAIERVNRIVAQVQELTRDQAVGISQVDTSLVDLDRATQQNAALVEESAAAASSLDQQAQGLLDQVARFRLEATAPR